LAIAFFAEGIWLKSVRLSVLHSQILGQRYNWERKERCWN